LGLTASTDSYGGLRIKVGEQMILTDHKLGIYIHKFFPDPNGLGVLGSITISGKIAVLDSKVIGSYWPPVNNLEGSVGRRLQSSQHLAGNNNKPPTPKAYPQIRIDNISDSYWSKPHHPTILPGDLNHPGILLLEIGGILWA